MVAASNTAFDGGERSGEEPARIVNFKKQLIYNDRVPENESQVDSFPTIMKITALLNFVLYCSNFEP